MFRGRFLKEMEYFGGDAYDFANDVVELIELNFPNPEKVVKYQELYDFICEQLLPSPISSSLITWLEDNIKEGVAPKDIYPEYLDWAKSNGVLILSRKEIGEVIRNEIGYVSIPRHSVKENKTVRVYEKIEY